MNRMIAAYSRVFPELLLLALLVFLTVNVLVNDFGILHNVNLIFHEAGHTLFSFFGEFISVLGGSLTQILIPLIVILASLREGRVCGIVFGLWWLGENFIDVSRYAADAQTRTLPLLGGDGVIHDWWYLLTNLRLIEHTDVIAGLLWWVGICVIGASMALLLRIIHDKLPENRL